MKKRIVLSMVVCTSLLLAGCGKRGGSDNEKLQIDKITELTSEATTTEVTTEATTEATTEEQAVGYPIDIAYPFSEGFAWVGFRGEEGDGGLGLIDTEGNLVYEVKSGVIINFNGADGMLDANNITDVYDGAALYMSDDEIVIIDTSGNELYHQDRQTEDGEYTYLYDYQGSYVIRRKYADIDQNLIYYYIIDKNGNDVVEPLVFENGGVGVTWYEDRMLAIGNFVDIGYFVNLETRETIILTPEIFGELTNRNHYHTYDAAMSYRDFLNQESYDNYVPNTVYRELCDEMDNLHLDDPDGLRSVFGLGSDDNYRRISAMYDTYTGEKLFDMPLGCENVYFSDEYIGVGIKGADGEKYFTVLDNDGNQLYEPVMVKGYFLGVDKGYVLTEENGSYSILTPIGEVFDVNDDLSAIGDGITIFSSNYEGSGAYGICISDGYIVSNHGYRSLDGSKEITEVIAK